MQVETEFDLKDEVFFVHENKIKKGIIKEIKIISRFDPFGSKRAQKPETIIHYTVKLGETEVVVSEENAFASVYDLTVALTNAYNKGLK